VLHGGGEPAAAVLSWEAVGSLKVEEEEGRRWAMGRSGRVGRMPLGPARREKRKKWDGPQGWLGRNDFGLRWEKKKNVFRFWFKEWYSNLNFKYHQTEFELDF
jgi:hypothetical protein